MNEFWHAAAGWAGQTLLAGAVVFGLTALLLRRVKAPGRRAALAAWAMRAAVVAAVVTLGPAWVRVKLPDWASATPRVVAVPPRTPPPPAAADAAPQLVAAADELPPVADEFLAFAEFEADEAAAVEPPAEPEPAPEPPPSQLAVVAPVLLLPFAAVAAAAVVQMILGGVALARLRRTARPAPERVRLALAGMAVPPRTRVLVSDHVPTPVCFGVFRPTVLLPAGLAHAASADQLHWVLAHELDHLHRGDPVTGLWAGVARGLYFLLPMFWTVRRELGVAQEQLADAAAAAAGGRAADYAAFLVDLSAVPRGRNGRDALARLAGSAGMRAGKSDLFRRVTMLLNPSDRAESRGSKVWAAVAAGGLLAAGVAVSGVGVVQADEPKVVTVRVVTEDADAPKPKDVKKDGEKKATETRTLKLVAAVDAEQIAKLEKAVAAAALKGDEKEVRAAVAKLKAALAPKAVEGTGRVLLTTVGEPKVVRVDGEPKTVALTTSPKVVRVADGDAKPATVRLWTTDGEAKPATVLMRVADGDAKPMTVRVARVEDADADVAKLEKAIEKLKATAKELEDQPEAKAAIEKSIAEYRKKIAEAKRAGVLKEVPKPAAAPKPAQAAPPGVPAPPAAPLPPAAPKAAQQAEALNKLMTFRQGSMDRLAGQLAGGLEQSLRLYEKKLAGLTDDPEAQAKLKAAMAEYRKAMDEAIAQLKANPVPMAWQIAPPAQAGAPVMLDPLDLRPGQNAAVAAAKTTYEPGKIGVVLVPVPDAVVDQFDYLKDKGLLVAEVIPGSPAAKAGVKAKDILLTIAGQDVSLDVNAVSKQVAAAGFDKPFDVVVLRKGKQETLKGVVIAKPADPKPATAAARKAVVEKLAEKKKGDGPAFTSIAISVNDDAFEIKAEGNGVTYKIDGTIADGKPTAKNIAIEESVGGKGYTGFPENLPAKYQPAVDKLLKNVGGK